MPRNGYTLWKLRLACLTYCDVITKLCYHSPYLASPHFCIYLDRSVHNVWSRTVHCVCVLYSFVLVIGSKFKPWQTAHLCFSWTFIGSFFLSGMTYIYSPKDCSSWLTVLMVFFCFVWSFLFLKKGKLSGHFSVTPPKSQFSSREI